MGADPRYRANPDVSCRDEGADGALLFDPDADDTAVVNPSGRELWGQLATPRTVAELAAHLVATSRGGTPAQAAADVAAFLQALAPRFVERVEGGDDA